MFSLRVAGGWTTGMRVGLWVMVGRVEGSGGGNREKTWLWDIKGTPCGRNDSSSPTRTWQADRRTQITQLKTDHQGSQSQGGEEGGGERGGCTAKYGWVWPLQVHKKTHTGRATPACFHTRSTTHAHTIGRHEEEEGPGGWRVRGWGGGDRKWAARRPPDRGAVLLLDIT